MTAYEINEKLRRLRYLRDELEAQYIENEGEVTEATESMEEEIALIKELLVDAPDDLARHMVSFEDAIQRDKNEEKAIAARRKRKEDYLDFIKRVALEIINEQPDGKDRIKGSLYTFKRNPSARTSVNYDALNRRYMGLIQQSVLKLMLPAWLSLELKASIKDAKDAGPLDPMFFDVDTKEVCQLLKPRKKDE